MMLETAKLVRSLVTYLQKYDTKDGKSITEVARNFGVTRHTIRKLSKLYNIQLKFVEQKGRCQEESMVYTNEDDKMTSRGAKITFPDSKWKKIRDNATFVLPKPELLSITPCVDPTKEVKGKETTKLPEDKQKFLRENYHRPLTELVIESGISKYIVKNFLLNEGLKRPKIIKVAKKGKKKGRPAFSISAEHKAYLTANHTRPATKLATETGIPVSRVRKFLKISDLSRSKTYTPKNPREKSTKLG
jgi:hypothetical protein